MASLGAIGDAFPGPLSLHAPLLWDRVPYQQISVTIQDTESDSVKNLMGSAGKGEPHWDARKGHPSLSLLTMFPVSEGAQPDSTSQTRRQVHCPVRGQMPSKAMALVHCPVLGWVPSKAMALMHCPELGWVPKKARALVHRSLTNGSWIYVDQA